MQMRSSGVKRSWKLVEIINFGYCPKMLSMCIQNCLFWSNHKKRYFFYWSLQAHWVIFGLFILIKLQNLSFDTNNLIRVFSNGNNQMFIRDAFFKGSIAFPKGSTNWSGWPQQPDWCSPGRNMRCWFRATTSSGLCPSPTASYSTRTSTSTPRRASPTDRVGTVT